MQSSRGRARLCTAWPSTAWSRTVSAISRTWATRGVTASNGNAGAAAVPTHSISPSLTGRRNQTCTRGPDCDQSATSGPRTSSMRTPGMLNSIIPGGSFPDQRRTPSASARRGPTCQIVLSVTAGNSTAMRSVGRSSGVPPEVGRNARTGVSGSSFNSEMPEKSRSREWASGVKSMTPERASSSIITPFGAVRKVRLAHRAWRQ